MGTTLTGKVISATYDALLKVTDNDPITSTAKQITDGLGNNTPLYISSTRVGIGVTPTTTFHVSGNSQIGGNLTVTGDLLVEGSTTTIDTSTLSVEDPLIIVGSNNTTSDAVDLGIYGVYDTSGSQNLYAGIFRRAADNKFHIFRDLQIEPTTTVNTSGTGYTVATLVGNLEGNVTGNITGNADTATALETARTIQVSGDIAGSASFDGTADINISTTIQPNSVALGTDTTGNYVATISGTANEITVSDSGSESAAVTISLPSSISVDVTGDLTGDVYNADGSIIFNTGDDSNDGFLVDGVRATTQSQGDNSTKIATTAYVDSAIGGQDTLSEVLANGNTTGGTDIAITAGDKITNFTSSGIDDNATSTALTLDASQNATFAGNLTVNSGQGAGYIYLGASSGVYANSLIDAAHSLEINSGSQSTNGVVRIRQNSTTIATFDSSSGVTVVGGVSATTFSGQLDGTISSATTATTQSQNDNSTKVATTAYVDSAIGGQDTLAEILANGNTTGGTDIIVSTSDQIFLPDGSVTNPAISFSNDTDSGIYHSGTQFIIAHAGSNKMIIANSQVTLEDRLIVNDTINADDGILIEGASNPYLSIHDETNETYTALWSGDTEAALTFSHSLFRITSSTNNFTGTDLVTITSGGNVGINDTNPSGAAGYTYLTINNASNGAAISFKESSTERAAIYYTNSSNLFNIYATETGSQLVFGTNAAERMRIDSSGIVRIFTTGGTSEKTYSAAAGLELYSQQSDAGFPYTKTSDIVANGDGTVPSELRMFTKASGSSTPTERMRIASDGSSNFFGEIHNEMSAPKIRLQPTTQNNASIIELGVLNAGTNAYARIDAINLSNYDTNLRFWTNAAGSTTQVERMRIDSSGNVKILNNNRLMLGPSGFEAGLKYATDGSLQIASRTGENITFTNGNDGTERMRIDSSGNVLITKQSANNGTVGNQFMTDGSANSTVNGDTVARFNRLTSDGEIIRLQKDTSTVGSIGSTTSYLNSSLAIGTTSPSAKLDVDGTIRLSTSGRVEGRSYPYTTNIGSTANATTTNITAGSTDKSEIALLGGDVGDRIEFKTNSTERMRIDSSGGVGIGASTIPADHRLQIHNPSFTYSRFALTNSATGSASGDGLKFQIENLNAIIKNQEDGYLTFGTNGRETDLHIDSSGQVGIGTTDPEDKLEVAGGALKVKASANHVEQTYIKFGRTDQADGNFEHHIKSMTGSGSTQNKMTFSLCDTSATGKVDLLTLDGGANKSYFASGSVGIGNTNPSGQLDILTSNETMIKLRNSGSTSGLDRDFKLDDNNKFEILDNSGTGVSLSQGSGSWSSESDERLKENIVELDSVLENIDNLRAVKYNYKKGNDTKIGFIAQDWQKDFSEVIEEGEHLQMKYTETIPVLLKAIQELKQEIEILKSK